MRAETPTQFRLPSLLSWTMPCILGIFLFLVNGTAVTATDHKSPRGTVILRLEAKSVSLVHAVTGATLAKVVDDPHELADVDGWSFESIDWNNEETLCVIRSSWGAHQKYHHMVIFRAASLAPVTKFENVDIGPLFQAHLMKDEERDLSLHFALRSATLTHDNVIKATFEATGKGSGQWSDDPEADRYEGEFEISAKGAELRHLWRIRREPIE